MSGEPSPQAETIRQEIKGIISRADGDGPTDVERLESRDGRITYIGKSLGFAVGELMAVLSVSPQEWGYTVWHFPNNRAVGNPGRNMQILSLSDNSSITPGGPLTDSLTTITHDAPVIGSGSTVIVFLRYNA
ncbi:hypothetical protein BJY01DRAFT_110851 [Aspergillus pseudoustus]|uniref:Uncharacterized protein n=1 Tax=Aspergillus pseudoustus TaxID=1810923 RepID=A0ABR4IT39_9EURO